MRAFRRTSVLVAVVTLAATLSPVAARATASAPPTVNVTTPIEGTTATDQLTVTAVAHIDSLDGDAGQFMALSVNGADPTTPDVPCQTVPDPSTCTATWVIDTRSLPPGTATLQVGVLTTDWETVSDPVHVMVPLHPPTARITSPADGTTFVPARTVPSDYWSGVLHITVQGGQLGAAPGTVATWQLVVDGVPTFGTSSCVNGWTTSGFCPSTLSWDAPFAGPHVLVARLTVGTTVVDSAPITVTVLRPSASITSPADGAVIDGRTSIVATGSVVTPGDTPTSMTLFVNGANFGQTVLCPPAPDTPGTCTTTFPWDGRFRSGTTSFRVHLTTAQSGGTSAPVSIIAYTHPGLALADESQGPAGTMHHLAGQVFNPPGAQGGQGLTISVAVTPAVGTPSTRQVVTGPGGTFALALRPRTNTTVTASLAATPTSAASSLTRLVPVQSRPHCGLPSRLTKKAVSMVRCSVQGLPDGVKVSIQFLAHKRWYVLRSAFSRRGVVVLPMHWDRKGSLEVRVVVGGSRTYVTTWGKPVLLKVS